MLLELDQWRALFGNFKKSAFRLEVHQIYTMPDEHEDFQRFLAGEPKAEEDNQRWHDTVQAHLAAGRSIQRVKVVHRPLSDYTRYLLEWGIPDNVAAGEDYRIVDLGVGAAGLPEQDFWLFDERIVVHLNYRPDGTQVSRELIESPDLSRYLEWRDVALRAGVSFNEWNAGT